MRSLFLLLLCFLHYTTANPDYLDKCIGTYIPDLSEDLKKCEDKGEDNGCEEGFECFNNVCCPTKDFVCSQSIESGREVEDLTHNGRFGFDSRLQNCIKFSYFGSQGNFNNFKNYNDCRQFCLL